jgi:hypothetical protein
VLTASDLLLRLSGSDFLRRLCIIVVIELGRRRVRITVTTAHPTGPGVTQQACNPLMEGGPGDVHAAFVGSRRIRPAMTARSTQSKRGVGLVGRSTATS